MVLISGLVHCYVCLCFYFHITQQFSNFFIVLGHLDSITTRIFRALAARFHSILGSFCFRYVLVHVLWTLRLKLKKYSALYLPFEKSLDVFFYSIISFTIHAFVHRDFVNYVRDAHGQVRLRQQEENLIYICWAAAVRIQLKFNAVTLREKGEHFRWWKLWAWIRGAAALPSSNPTRRETSPHSASSECMGRKGVREGALAPLWILKLLAKKGCFFNFEG